MKIPWQKLWKHQLPPPKKKKKKPQKHVHLLNFRDAWRAVSPQDLWKEFRIERSNLSLNRMLLGEPGFARAWNIN